MMGRNKLLYNGGYLSKIGYTPKNMAGINSYN